MNIAKELAELAVNGIKPTRVAFTGPRPKKLGGYDEENYHALNHELKDILRQLINDGTNTFISGGAQGFDQLAFWTVNSLKKEYKAQNVEIKNNLYLPFNGQEKKWAPIGLFSQSQYDLMKDPKYADCVKYISDVDTSDYTAVTKALYARNEAMVNDCNLVVALYDSSTWMSDQRSGTAGCMRYAAKKNKPILQLVYAIERGVPYIANAIMLQ